MIDMRCSNITLYPGIVACIFVFLHRLGCIDMNIVEVLPAFVFNVSFIVNGRTKRCKCLKGAHLKSDAFYVCCGDSILEVVAEMFQSHGVKLPGFG